METSKNIAPSIDQRLATWKNKVIAFRQRVNSLLRRNQETDEERAIAEIKERIQKHHQ